MRAFTAAATRRRRAELRDLALTTRAAQADKQHFKDFLRSIDRGD